MHRTLLILLGLAWTTGCSSTPEEPAVANVTDDGRQAYEHFCAGCHETGMLGAPIAGDAEYWRGRSTLWQAVLMEHAKEGYYEMPAKGGRPDVSDELIDAATEYMLRITFPNLPADQ